MWESIGFKAGLVVNMKRDAHETNDKVPSRGLTHAGVFHADDVFATALLRTLNPHIEIVRSNVVPRGFDGIVYDIGGGEFDHHALDARKRANGMPFSSFGIIWGKYWSLLLCDDDAAEFDKDFVQPIDLADNGGPTCFATQCVADFNPCGTTVHDYDPAFWRAVTWAQDVLERRLASLRARRADQAFVLDAMERCDGEVLMLDRYAPWQPSVVGSGYIYVIYPSVRGGFNAQCVPERLGDKGMVRPFPQQWRGLPAEELRCVTGIADVTFCHPSGFLCAAKTLVGAVGIARLALAWDDTP